MELTVNQTLKMGIAFQREGKLQDAERLYRAILKSQPTHPDANHNLGVLAVSLNKAAIALPFLEAAIEFNPSIEQFWISYICALIKEEKIKDAKRVFKKAKQAGFSGEQLNAVEMQLTQINQKNLNEKLTRLQSPPQVEINKMLANYQKEQYKMAQSLARSITKKFPDHALSWQVFVAASEQTGEVEEALIANQNIVRLEPKNADSHFALGIRLQQLGELEQAKASYEQSIALRSGFVEAHSNLGITLKDLGRFEQAEASFMKAIALKPDFVDAYINLGNMLQQLGRLEQAEISCRQAIKLKPEEAKSHNNLGVTLRNIGKLEQAEASYRQAIALKLDFVDAHNNLGAILYELGKLKQAETSYRQAIALNPSHFKAHNNLGATLNDLGELKQAESSYRCAIALKPDYAEGYYNLGLLLFEANQYAEAAEHFKFSDFGKSSRYLLRCLYLQNKKILFYDQLDYLIDQGTIDPMIGSLVCRSELRYEIERSNLFCNDPLNYVFNTDLSNIYDFQNIFVKTARTILGQSQIPNKRQSLLINGYQTSGNLFSLERDLTKDIQKIIHLEIENYLVNFKDSKEGLITNWPTEYSLYGWLVSMTSGGQLRPHMHEQGWISGSIYINVPSKLTPKSGNLVVCLEEDNLMIEDETQQKSIDVVTGSLCLFPASLLHYTVPFASKEERIVLAFDVVPKN